MAITILQNGIYQFSTIDNSTDKISFVTGTSSPLPRVYNAGITLYTSSVLYSNEPNTKIVDTINNYGVIRNYGLYATGISSTSNIAYIASNTITSSIDTADKLIISGGLYIINGTANHHIILPDSNEPLIRGSIIKIFKDSASGNSIQINPAGTSKINGALQQSCTDQYCSIELFASPNTTTGWCILSSIGTWT